MDDEFVRRWEYAVVIVLLIASVWLCIVGWQSRQLEVSRSTVTAGIVAAFLGTLSISLQRKATDSRIRLLRTYFGGFAVTGLLDLGFAWMAAHI